jgi:hypothetical protein
VAALCVNVPGFPIPHAALALSQGVQLSLVAAGVVQRAAEAPVQLAAAVADELELRDRRRRMAALRGAANRERIAKLRG